MADKPPCELRSFARSLRLSEWPETPQLDSGHLAVSNRGWRTLWPEVIAENCNYCSLCFVYCPDAAITLDAKGLPHIEPDWCKGCGVCAVECPKDAIKMIEDKK